MSPVVPAWRPRMPMARHAPLWQADSGAGARLGFADAFRLGSLDLGFSRDDICGLVTATAQLCTFSDFLASCDKTSRQWFLFSTLCRPDASLSRACSASPMGPLCPLLVAGRLSWAGLLRFLWPTSMACPALESSLGQFTPPFLGGQCLPCRVRGLDFGCTPSRLKLPWHGRWRATANRR